MTEGVICQARFDRTETFAESYLLFVGDILIVKDEHNVFLECAPKLLEVFLIDTRGDINTLNFGSDVFAQFFDREGFAHYLS